MNGAAILAASKNENGYHLSIDNGLFTHQSTNGGDQNASNGAPMTKPDLDYLAQLLKDKKQLSAFPNVFSHVERLVDDEINRVRVTIFQCEFSHEPLQLPEPIGEVAIRQEKVFVPVKQYPEYNFVGRILGPRGMTAKQLETETGCKIMVRGKGSTRDKKKEEMNRGKPNWEHLSEDLHVIIQCEDTPNRAELKMARAVEEVNKLLVPAPEGEDDLKKKQLMELAIINGTFRSSNGIANGGATANRTASPSTNAAVAALGKSGAVACNGSVAASLLQLDPRLLGCSTAALSNAVGLAGTPLIMPSATASSAAVQPSLVAVNNSLAAQALALQLTSPAQTAAQLFSTSPYTNGLAASFAQATTAPNAIDYQQQLLALSQLQQPQTQPSPIDVATQSQQLTALFQQQQLALSALQQQQFDYGSAAGGSGGGGGGYGSSSGGKTDHSSSSSTSSIAGGGAGHIMSGHRRFVGHSRDSAHPYGGA